MRITKASLYIVEFPLKEPFIISYASYPTMPAVILKLETDTGITGYGEAVPDEHVTGEHVSGTFEILKHVLLPRIMNQNPFDIEKIHFLMDTSIARNPAAKAAVDIACYDLMGKAANQPVYNLIGGRAHETLQYAKVLSIEAPAVMAEKAVAAKNLGFSSLKLKLGLDEPAMDIARVYAVREAVGEAMPIRIDVNQGWKTAGQAIHTINQLQDANLTWVEQPIRMGDLRGLAEIRQKTSIPVMADESVHSMEDVLEIIRLEAADFINIKLMKSGGIYPAVQMAKAAESAGIIAQIGSMVESSIGSAAGYHAVMSRRNIQSAELTGPLLFKEEIGDLEFKPPHVHLSGKPGLGITVDEAQLAKLTRKSAKLDGSEQQDGP
ncbi:mandelate racemase/muconate lactonizing enzyme family protein [Planomicrobium sp. CPCC 101079]|uniref:mandelate racemase/muconate lactonizing enzyme family protein n=1 Tax=Planomicrobium sp. CPCC 101079 TaxID=2599618 RepID=UPI0011B47801|nr:dipeptide epimerase [Planomicrobium sp. CPCC 101079]TWT03564.1 dipeptide epimerase [Planomicrobium sp. CPCC 101079]